MITFKGSFVDNSKIYKLGINNKWHTTQAAFVKIDPLSKDDRLALNTANCYWDNCQSYLNEICAQVNRIFIADDSEPAEDFFILTSQKENFDKLVPEDILGVAQTTNIGDDLCQVEYLQVDPEHKFESEFRRFCGIGKAILKNLFKLVPDRNVFLLADENAKGFYFNLGFSNPENDDLMLYNNKNKES